MRNTTVEDRFPIPPIDNLMDELGCSRVNLLEYRL